METLALRFELRSGIAKQRLIARKSGVDSAFDQPMEDEFIRRPFDFVYTDRVTGTEYEVNLIGRLRPDRRWEGRIEYVPRSGGDLCVTDVETTQPSADDLVYWAKGLGNAYFEGAFARAERQRAKPREAGDATASGTGIPSLPTDPAGRLAHLQAVEHFVMDQFKARKATALRSDEIFGSGRYANADLVRAFEHLEKSWRYLVRQTEGGVDRLRLTTKGAEAIELKIEDGMKTVAEPPRGV